jgi:tryptophan synthase alpha chain
MIAKDTSRITGRFSELRERGEKGLVIYLTAGDPTLDATGNLLVAVDRAGADVIELGVPFSDPLADGPVIQRASQRALASGATLKKILARMPEWRKALRAPVILFGYYNPVLHYGIEQFADEAAAAGVDGALIVDLTPEEAGAYLKTMRTHHLDTVFLVAPTSTDQRMRQVSELSSGFLYLVSRTGVTGERTQISESLGPLVERVRRFNSLPLAVGFGISNPAQVRAVQSMGDAAVVGSAVVHEIEKQYSSDHDEAAAKIEQFVRWLKTGSESAAL